MSKMFDIEFYDGIYTGACSFDIGHDNVAVECKDGKQLVYDIDGKYFVVRIGYIEE